MAQIRDHNLPVWSLRLNAAFTCSDICTASLHASGAATDATSNDKHVSEDNQCSLK